MPKFYPESGGMMRSKIYSQRVCCLGRNITEETLAKARQVRGVVSLAGGTPPFSIPSKFFELIFSQAKRNVKLSQYPDSTQGLLSLREVIAEDLSTEFDREVSSEEILITVGSSAGLYASFQALLDPRDEVLLFSPYWSNYVSQIVLASGVVKPVVLDELRGWGIDVDRLQGALTSRSRVVLLNDPHNPTGSVFGGVSKRWLLKLARRRKLIIFADETYRHLVYGKGGFESIGRLKEDSDLVLVFRSFSKDFMMSGFRLGFVYGKRELIDQIKKVHIAMNLCPSVLSQELGRLMYLDKEEVVKGYLGEYDRRRRFVCDRLEDLKLYFDFVKPKGGFFVFPKCLFGTGSFEVFELLLGEKVAVRPGIDFGKEWVNHFRLSYIISMKDLEEAFRRVKMVCNRLKGT